MQPPHEDPTLVSEPAPTAPALAESSDEQRVFTRADIPVALAIAVAAGAAYLPAVLGWPDDSGDYAAHARYAQEFAENGTLFSPACFLHITVAGIVKLGLSASYTSAMLAVVVCSYAATPAVMYLWAKWILRELRGRTRYALPIGIALVGPFLQPLVPLGTGYTIGYLWAEPYHSPTYAFLKPFAVAAAAFAVYFLTASRKPSWKTVALSAAAVAAGTLTKPSYAISALPALVLYAALQHRRAKSFSKIGVVCGWLLPALAVLGWQYYRTYGSWEGGERYKDAILFAPLAVMRAHSTDLGARYFWSVLPALAVLLAYGRRALDDEGLRFTLTAFLFGTMYTYLLSEQFNLASGNFLWSAYITLCILYLYSALFVVKMAASKPASVASWARATPCLAIIAWQLVTGISVHWIYMALE